MKKYARKRIALGKEILEDVDTRDMQVAMLVLEKVYNATETLI